MGSSPQLTIHPPAPVPQYPFSVHEVIWKPPWHQKHVILIGPSSSPLLLSWHFTHPTNNPPPPPHSLLPVTMYPFYVHEVITQLSFPRNLLIHSLPFSPHTFPSSCKLWWFKSETRSEGRVLFNRNQFRLKRLRCLKWNALFQPFSVETL